MAICHMTYKRDGFILNLCDSTTQGLWADDETECTCVQCLKILVNTYLIKIDELEDDLMVANRAIAFLSERKENGSWPFVT